MRIPKKKTLVKDSELVERLREGDEQAFNELVRKYQQPIYQTARRLLGSHQEAEDLSQEVFIKAYDQLKNFRQESSVFTWIYRITINMALNVLRKRKIKQAFSLESPGLSIASDAQPADQKLERDETLQAVNRAIERLPHKQKIVFTLRHDQGLSHREISRILGRYEGTIRANYHQAIRKLQKAVTL